MLVSTFGSALPREGERKTYANSRTEAPHSSVSRLGIGEICAKGSWREEEELPFLYVFKRLEPFSEGHRAPPLSPL